MTAKTKPVQFGDIIVSKKSNSSNEVNALVSVNQGKTNKTNSLEIINSKLNNLINEVENSNKNTSKSQTQINPLVVIPSNFLTEFNSSFSNKSKGSNKKANFKSNTTLKNETLNQILPQIKLNQNQNNLSGFNNQASLFEEVSIFGKLIKQIKSHREIPHKPLLKRLSQQSIRKIPIETEEEMNKRFIFTSKGKKSFMISHLLVNIASFCLILAIIGSLFYAINLNEKQDSKALQTIENSSNFKFKNITVPQNEILEKISSDKLNIDENKNGLLNWQDFYLGIDHTTNKASCRQTDYSKLILELINPLTCTKINLSQTINNPEQNDSDFKVIELLKNILYNSLEFTPSNKSSLTTILGIQSLNEINEGEIIKSLEKKSKANALKITKINSLISTFLIENKITLDKNISGIYYLESSLNYQIDIAKILTILFKENTESDKNNLLFKDNNFSQENQLDNLNNFTSYFSNINKLSLDECDKYLLYNQNFKNCEDIKSLNLKTNFYLQ
jgi:hypothetical protein